MYSLKGLAGWAAAARKAGIEDAEVNTFINGSVFATLTNGAFASSPRGRGVQVKVI